MLFDESDQLFPAPSNMRLLVFLQSTGQLALLLILKCRVGSDDCGLPTSAICLMKKMA